MTVSLSTAPRVNLEADQGDNDFTPVDNPVRAGPSIVDSLVVSRCQRQCTPGRELLRLRQEPGCQAGLHPAIVGIRIKSAVVYLHSAFRRQYTRQYNGLMRIL